MTTDQRIIYHLEKAQDEMVRIYDFCMQQDIDVDCLRQSLDKLYETIDWYERYSL